MTNRTIILAGNNVSLVEMSEDDQPHFFTWISEDEELRTLIDDPEPPTMEGQMRWFKRIREPDRKMLSIVTEPDHILIGNGGFVNIENHEAEFRFETVIPIQTINRFQLIQA